MGGTRHELDTTGIIMVLALDMRYNTAIYVRHKFVDYHPLYIPPGEVLAPDQELFLVNTSGGFLDVTISDDESTLTHFHAKKKWLGVPNIGLM